ncbi:UspA [Dillenia turbinata]|uniref:UspA n=1 Tax=Dillenia turbinata TaxID=194707 RepID=A0AAN8Z2U0_9MAGN
MGRTRTRVPSICLGRASTGVRARSPRLQTKATYAFPKSERKVEFFGSVRQKSFGAEKAKSGFVSGNKIMVVVDSTSEAKCALQWSLSHTVQCHDTIVLLHVIKPSKPGNGRISDKRANEVLHSMRSICQMKRPEVKIEVALTRGKEKGPAILAAAKQHGASLLVLGQRRRTVVWRLIMMWRGNRVRCGVVEYCIQNASCMAIAVRRKGRNLGGYLITTKRQKDFWLLA